MLAIRARWEAEAEGLQAQAQPGQFKDVARPHLKIKNESGWRCSSVQRALVQSPLQKKN